MFFLILTLVSAVSKDGSDTGHSECDEMTRGNGRAVETLLQDQAPKSTSDPSRVVWYGYALKEMYALEFKKHSRKCFFTFQGCEIQDVLSRLGILWTAKGVKKLAPFATKESADSPGPRLIEQLTKKMKDKKSASMSFEISPAEREVFEELRGFWEGHVIPGMQVQEGGQLKTRFSANEIKLIPHQDVRFKTFDPTRGDVILAKILTKNYFWKKNDADLAQATDWLWQIGEWNFQKVDVKPRAPRSYALTTDPDPRREMFRSEKPSLSSRLKMALAVRPSAPTTDPGHRDRVRSTLRRLQGADPSCLEDMGREDPEAARKNEEARKNTQRQPGKRPVYIGKMPTRKTVGKGIAALYKAADDILDDMLKDYEDEILAACSTEEEGQWKNFCSSEPSDCCAIQALALLRAVYAKLGERPEQTNTLREVLEGNDRLWLRLLQ